jgi:putative hydrolase of the HAD superfamily
MADPVPRNAADHDAPRPSAVLFDFWNTLVESDAFTPARGNARLLALAGCPVPIEEVQAFEDGIVHDAERREDECWLEFSRQSLQRLLNDRFDIRSPLSLAEQEWEFWSSSMRIRLVEGVERMFEDLARRSIRAAVVSNTSFTAETLHRTLADLGVAGRLEFVISSADYGVRKPHPAIFRTALARLGLGPDEAWFAGDTVGYDLEGGRGAGMFTVLFNTRDEVPPGLEGYARIDRWNDLAGLLNARRPAMG